MRIPPIDDAWKISQSSIYTEKMRKVQMMTLMNPSAVEMIRSRLMIWMIAHMIRRTRPCAPGIQNFGTRGDVWSQTRELVKMGIAGGLICWAWRVWPREYRIGLCQRVLSTCKIRGGSS